MDDLDYKKQLDKEVNDILKDVNIKPPQRNLTWTQKFSEKCCNFLGNWSWFWVLTLITVSYICIQNFIPFDPYPYNLYTMIISVWALYSNVFVQMSTNIIMEQLMWIIGQIFDIVQRVYISLLLLHEKVDLIEYQNSCIIEYLKSLQKK
jgi:uncharacterized membrane protein